MCLGLRGRISFNGAIHRRDRTVEREREREGRNSGSGACLPSSVPLEKEQNKKSDLKWIPPSLHVLALYRVPFLLARASEGHASCPSILYRMSA